MEASIQEATLFSQVVEQARTRVASVMDGLDAQVRALAG
jgi:hypothetical protein